MYHQDWFVRQIEIITRYVFSLILGKADALTGDVRLDTQQPTEADTGTLSFQLGVLVRAERLCEAENLLYEAVDSGDPEALEAGLRFYGELNALSDETLERCGLPRDEVLSGLRELCVAYGLDLSPLSL